jgi:hypothetical protein
LGGDGDVASTRATSFVHKSVRADDLAFGITQNRETQIVVFRNASGIWRGVDGYGQQVPAQSPEFLLHCSETSEFCYAKWSPMPAVENE